MIPLKTILIVDDHDVVRYGVCRIIAEAFGNMRFIHAANANVAIEILLRDDAIDLLVADVELPGRSGIELLREARVLAPKLPVIIITAFSEVEYGLPAMRAGAAGFVQKTNVSDELPAAIRKVCQGQRYVSSELAVVLAAFVDQGHEGEAHESLSERERTVMRMIIDGKETKEISTELGLSEKTVATYRARVYRKLHVRNPVELTRYAFRHGLIR